MANRAQLKITGIDELRHAVKAYGTAIVDGAVDAVRDAVEGTVQEAKAAAPFATGALRDSIKGSYRTDGYEVMGMVRAGVAYAAVIEMGTQRVKKHPYLLPAAIKHRRDLTNALRRVVIDHAPADLGTPRVTGEGPSTPPTSID